MGLGAKFKGAAIGAYLGSLRDTSRGWQGLKRRLRGGRHKLVFYHQVDDPWSHLLALALPRLMGPNVELSMVLVPPPAADADPEPIKRVEHARRDAALLARRHGFEFPDHPVQPAADRVRRANAVLLVDRPIEERLSVAAAIGRALWLDDSDALASLVREHGTVPGQQVMPTLERNYRDLRRAGHYQGAMIRYQGEWFWGLDRLPHLCRAMFGRDADPAALLPAVPVFTPEPAPAPLEAFVSFRSPYSYLGAAEVEKLVAARPEVPFSLRPVLPMVTRGLPVPRDKRMYIVRDAKREAERLGVPFGRLCDPLGEGVERCLALAYVARTERGDRAALRWVVEAGAAIWSRAVDLTRIPELREVAERAQVADLVDASLTCTEWRTDAEQNREALSEAGLWGVPSFRQGAFVAWGQDRLWALQERLGVEA